MDYQNIFPWNTHYETGVESIDDQHKKLVELLNIFCNKTCAAMIREEDFKSSVYKSLNDLVDYTRFHFEYEEKIYEQYFKNETFFKKHQESHKGLAKTAEHFLSEFNLKTGDFEIEVFVSTLVLWLSEHILTDDMRMFSIILKINGGMSLEESVRMVNAEMDGEKRQIAETMTSMMKVSTALSMNLRHEIGERKKVERELIEEIIIRKKTEKKLKFLSQHDGLTGLPNRHLFEELSGLALSHAKRGNKEQAILFIDIDGFKAVNDSLGHKAGDALLILIAKRLKECVRESDVVARIGGDEFVIHLGGRCGVDDAKIIAGKINTSISMPFKLEKDTANVGASIGISTYPSDAKDVETLVKNADAAMYVAKKAGKNAYKLFIEC